LNVYKKWIFAYISDRRMYKITLEFQRKF